MPQPKGEILVPLDESDFLAHCERQEQEIRKLKAALAEKDEAIDQWQEQYIKDIRINAEQIATLKGEIADLNQAQECSEEFAEKELERYKNAHEAAERELTKIQRYLNDLLAIIHRDGGHYQAEHGYEKAVRDAINVISQQMEQIAALIAKRDEDFELAMTESAPDYERVPRLYSLVHHLKAEIEKLKLEMNRMVRY